MFFFIKSFLNRKGEKRVKGFFFIRKKFFLKFLVDFFLYFIGLFDLELGYLIVVGFIGKVE